MKLRSLKENRVSRERGKTHVSYVFLVLLVVVLGYLSYRIVPVYLHQDAFDEELLDLAGEATRGGWDDGKIVKQVRQLGTTRDFQIQTRHIKIHRVRDQSKVSLEVNYTRSEKFPGGYVHVFSFSSSSEGSYFF
jgi:hypothetical protein